MRPPQGTAPFRLATKAAVPWVAPAAAALAALGTLLWSLPRGLDLTDEGYYLAEIAHPGDTASTALLFGWAWHPVYAATGGSVVGLRLVGFALVAALAAALALTVLRLGPTGERPGRGTVSCVAALTAALAFVPLSTIPATPSYNTLAWLSLATAALGCALAWTGRRPTLGGALVGAAGAAAVLAKPTTALALAVVVLLTTPWRRTGIRPIVAAAAVLLACATVLLTVVPGHLDGLVDIVRRGVDATVGHAELVRRDPYLQSQQILLAITLAGLAGAASGALVRRRPVLAAVAACLPTVLALAMLWRWWHGGLITDVDLGLPFAALTCFGLLVAGAFAIAVRNLRRGTAPGSVRVRLAVLLMLLPPAYAFGTNNNLWHWAGQLVVFWFLAIILLVGTTGPLAAAAGALAAYTALVSAVVTPLDPYRSAPLTQTEPTRVSREGQTLRLPLGDVQSTAEMLSVGDQLAVTRETAVLDLTGASPGIAWAWGARPLGSGWIIGGYPESRDAARTSIEPVHCALGRALVLWAPDGARSLPADVLAPWGVDVPGDYRVAATFRQPRVPGRGAVASAGTVTVQVLQPVTVSPPPGCPPPA